MLLVGPSSLRASFVVDTKGADNPSSSSRPFWLDGWIVRLEEFLTSLKR